MEVGSYEGASACYVVETITPVGELELHCVDSWEGGIEHQDASMQMSHTEMRFHHNMAVAASKAPHKLDLHVHKGNSDVQLAKLLAEGKQGYFDMVYIDGSHQAPDVLCDAVLGFKLLKVGGLLVFDDYLWAETLPNGPDLLRCPKPAIDAFINLYFRKLQILTAPLYQIYTIKTAM
nr:class I SAM-dependent methyltransferase [Niveispirillum sp. BGYR6]